MDEIEAIVAVIRARVAYRVDIGIICGSGLSGLSAIIEDPISVPYSAVPFLPTSTVAGHGTEFVFGRLHGRAVVAARGRFHCYEGYSAAESSILTRIFAALGARVLIVTNAAGGINPALKVGDVMVIKDHVSFPGLAGHHALTGRNDERFGPRFPAQGTAVFVPALQDALHAAGAALGMTAVIKSGTYMGVWGPTYESPAEVAMLRTLGGDTVGMSTVHEVAAAAHCGIAVLGLSLVTNACLAPGDTAPPPTHEEVDAG